MKGVSVLSSSSDADLNRSPGSVWGVLVLLALAIGWGAAVKTVLSPVQEAVRLDLRLSDVQISLAQGLAASLPVALLSIPLGRMADRRSRRWILVGASATWTLGALLTGLAPGFAALFAARTLAGLGGGVAIPAALSLAADLSPPQRRGRALIVLALGNAAGAAAAFTFGGLLMGILGRPGSANAFGLAPWRGVQLVFAVVSAGVTLLLLLIREPARRELGSAPGGAFGAVAKELWARRALLAPLIVGQVGVIMADTAAGVWAAPLLIRRFALRPEQFAGWLGGVVLLAGVVGAVAGGVLADWGQRRRPPGGVLFGAAAASLIAVPAAMFALAPGVGGFGFALCVLLVCGVIAGTVTSTAVLVLIPNELRGLCTGAFLVLGAVVGLGVAPTLVPLLAGALGGGEQLGPALAITDGVVGVCSAAGFCLAARRVGR